MLKGTNFFGYPMASGAITVTLDDTRVQSRDDPDEVLR